MPAQSRPNQPQLWAHMNPTFYLCVHPDLGDMLQVLPPRDQTGPSRSQARGAPARCVPRQWRAPSRAHFPWPPISRRPLALLSRCGIEDKNRPESGRSRVEAGRHQPNSYSAHSERDAKPPGPRRHRGAGPRVRTWQRTERLGVAWNLFPLVRLGGSCLQDVDSGGGRPEVCPATTSPEHRRPWPVFMTMFRVSGFEFEPRDRLNKSRRPRSQSRCQKKPDVLQILLHTLRLLATCSATEQPPPAGANSRVIHAFSCLPRVLEVVHAWGSGPLGKPGGPTRVATEQLLSEVRLSKACVATRVCWNIDAAANLGARYHRISCQVRPLSASGKVQMRLIESRAGHDRPS